MHETEETIQAPSGADGGSTQRDPIVTAETVLVELSTGGNSQALAAMVEEYARTVLAIVSREEPEPCRDPIDVLASREIDTRGRRLAAIWLVRLLAANRNCYTLSQLRFGVRKLCDSSLQDIYRNLGVEGEKSADVRVHAIVDLLGDLEASVKGIISATQDLRHASKARHDFSNTVNRKTAKALLGVFLPRDLQSRLDDVFAVVEEYVGAPESLKAEAYREAATTIQSYLADVRCHSTRYTREYLGGMAGRLLELLQDDFGASPLGSPASLLLTASEKKLPLSEVGARFDLSLLVTNSGPGYAISATVRITDHDDSITIDTTSRYLARVETGSFLVSFPARLVQAAHSVVLAAEVMWTDFDGNERRHEDILELQGQKPGLNWRKLEYRDPYSLDPVTTEEELVGRDEVLRALVTQTTGRIVKSTILWGQKRVGKTSVAKTLVSRLLEPRPDNFTVHYLDGGDYINPDPRRTIEQLGRAICDHLRWADDRFRDLTIPVFDGALSPVTDFLLGVQRIAPGFRMLLILDEFDELPLELYKRGATGDALFLTLRSISNKDTYGLVLVGGEQMEFILNSQGIHLNKFRSIRVDYFDKERHWTDFQQLVRRPTEDCLEISEDALGALYHWTAGNPYYTKLICGTLYSMMVDRRDAHVTRQEIEEATRKAVDAARVNSFQHFWDDGIFETGPAEEARSVNRRKVLLGVAEALRTGTRATVQAVGEVCGRYGMDRRSVASELKDLERRQVLVKDDDSYDFKVPFFGEWLRERGVRELMTTVLDEQAQLVRRQEEEEAYVRAEEIGQLVRGWGLYQGRAVGGEQVRAWLLQFGPNQSQRLMFRLLKGLRFYDGNRIRESLRQAHQIVRRDSLVVLEQGRRKRQDILVTYLDGVGKSGARLAQIYADENRLALPNVVERSRLARAVEELEGASRSLVFVDDFLGTGSSAIEYFQELDATHGDQLRESNLRLFFVVVAGFVDAKLELERVLQKLNLPVTVHVVDPLTDEDRCFTEASRIFPDLREREEALNVAYEQGRKLERQWPLGFGDRQAAVVFEDNCPNNSLPVLWKRSAVWTPLFQRV